MVEGIRCDRRRCFVFFFLGGHPPEKRLLFLPVVTSAMSVPPPVVASLFSCIMALIYRFTAHILPFHARFPGKRAGRSAPEKKQSACKKKKTEEKEEEVPNRVIGHGGWL